jgi:hypothetical protein
VSKHAPAAVVAAAAAAAAAAGGVVAPAYVRGVRRHAGEWREEAVEEDQRKYASVEWLAEEKRDCNKRSFATLMRSWPFWNHEYSRCDSTHRERESDWTPHGEVRFCRYRFAATVFALAPAS